MNKITKLLAIFSLTICSTFANAGLITDQAAITSAGQSFEYNFSGLDPVSGTAGVFTLFGRGDFTVSAGSGDSEWATFDIDGLVSGLAHPRIGAPASIIITEHSMQDVSFSATFDLSSSDITNIFSDGMLDISLAITNAVNIIDGNSMLGFSLSYKSASVPEPSTLAVFALGIFGLVSRKLKK